MDNKKICPNCNAVVKGNIAFCTKCGHKFNANEEPKQEVPVKKGMIDFLVSNGYGKTIIVGLVGVCIVLGAVLYKMNNAPNTNVASNSEIVEQEANDVSDLENSNVMDNGVEEEIIEEPVINKPEDSKYIPGDGEVYRFGSYEQDGNLKNGPESIEWITLRLDTGDILLVSKYVLDYQPYHKGNSNPIWENCSLRAWLNDTFYNTAFNSEQKSRIVYHDNQNVTESISLSNGKTANSVGGNKTYENIVIFRATAYDQYVPQGVVSRLALGTPYAFQQKAKYLNQEVGTYSYDFMGYALRGMSNTNGPYVNADGEYAAISGKNSDCYGVRPVLFIRE